MNALVLLSGCNGAIPHKLVNTSPEISIQDESYIKTIPATVSIITDKPDFIADVTIALNRYLVFSDIFSGNGELQLVVKHETVSDYYISEGPGRAILSGLIFGMSGNTVDGFDYSVIVNAELKYRNKIIASYKAKGSFHSVVSSSSALDSKMQRTTEVVLKSFNHALDLLATKIQKDRSKIIEAISI